MFEQLQNFSPFKSSRPSQEDDAAAASTSQPEQPPSIQRRSLSASSSESSPISPTEKHNMLQSQQNGIAMISPDPSHRFEDVQQGFLDPRTTTDAGHHHPHPSTPKTLFSSATKSSNSNNNKSSLQQPSMTTSSDSSTEDLPRMMTMMMGTSANVTPSPAQQQPQPNARYHHHRSSRRKSRSHRRGGSRNSPSSSLSHSLLLDGYDEGGGNNNNVYNNGHRGGGPVAVRRRSSQRDFRRTASNGEAMQQPLLPNRGLISSCASDGYADAAAAASRHYRESSISSQNDFMTSSPDLSSESSPDSSPNRMVSGMHQLQQQQQQQPPHRQRSYDFQKDRQRSIRKQGSFSSSSRISGNFSDPSYASGLQSSINSGGGASRSSFLKSSPTNANKKWSSRYWCLAGTFFGMVFVSLLGMIHLTHQASHVPYDMELQTIDRPDMFSSAAGLRGKMTQGHWDDTPQQAKPSSKPKTVVKKAESKPEPSKGDKKKAKQRSSEEKKDVKQQKTPTKPPVKTTKKIAPVPKPKVEIPAHLKMNLPPPMSLSSPKFEARDPNMYTGKSGSKSKSTSSTKDELEHPRIVMLDPSVSKSARKIQIYPADFTDNTQLYGVLPSDDERLSRMEIRDPYSEGECVPMQDWQVTFHPSCNGMHEVALETLGASGSGSDVPLDGVASSAASDDFVDRLGGVDAELFGTKGFWRYAWKVTLDHYDDEPEPQQETFVLKNLKYEHNFEDAHFEHDRVDAVAMERLTASPHVINIFGFCGHSVVTEYADGSRVGELADKAKKSPLERLRIARDIANGLADVHGIDGDGNATFVHLDVNPANVVSIGGTLKLNDFNIGIIRRWNTTSNEPCGFPAQYPNPQWRSPEEARGEQYLTEKVDIFSMGHIFFRLVCGHEPWNKLEPGGKPSKEEINRKVQKGETPFIPDHVRKSENPEVIAIRDAMFACYKPNPKDRPSAREIAKTLDATLLSLSSQN